MTKNVRVLVANQPRLMRELVLATIADQPDIDVVGEVKNESDIVRTVEEQRPDFLIVALGSARTRPAVCDELLLRFPEMKILAVAPERNSSQFFWASLDIHSGTVEASEEGILGVLRNKPQGVGGLS